MAFPIAISISREVLAAYPATKVAVAHVRGQVVDTKKLKKGPVNKFLSEYKQEVVRGLIAQGTTNANFQELKVCKSWAKVFSTFEADQDKRSTIVTLLDKATKEADKIQAGAKNADLGRISDIVDLYNAVSIATRTPMGTVRPSAVSGEIVLRYGKQEPETFIPLGKDDEKISVTDKHIVYADDKSILTWLWNCRDAKHSCVPASTDSPIDVLVFADQAEDGAGDAKAAIDLLASKITNINWSVLQTVTLDKDTPRVTLGGSVSSSSAAAASAAAASAAESLPAAVSQLTL